MAKKQVELNPILAMRKKLNLTRAELDKPRPNYARRIAEMNEITTKWAEEVRIKR